MASYVRDRGFSSRNYLEFFFDSEPKTPQQPQDKQKEQEKKSTSSSFSVKVPLFENPQISESKQARLGKYKPIGRNSNLYAFLGADSRVINFTFSMTLPHLHDYVKDLSLDTYIVKRTSPTGSSSEDKSLFDPNRKNKEEKPKSIADLLEVMKSYEAQYNSYVEPGSQSSLSEEALKVKTLYYFWTNIIRSSVIGTSDHRSPPPIVRLTYGPLYKRVPFLVERYQISIEERNSYDVVTMLPHKIKISLQMEEIRVGNFGKYDAYSPTAGNLLDGENVAGWEAILATGSLDPLTYPVTDLGDEE